MSATPTRWTRQLKAIVDIVYGSEGPLTADQVYAKARKRMPNISLGTVYRNLNKLVGEGLLSETKIGNVTAFIRHPFSNATFECERCKKLFCVPYDIRNPELERSVGMRVSRWSLRITGICKECEAKCT
jgi:Fur family peroxide stress response transcriptional regulator